MRTMLERIIQTFKLTVYDVIDLHKLNIIFILGRICQNARVKGLRGKLHCSLQMQILFSPLSSLHFSG